MASKIDGFRVDGVEVKDFFDNAPDVLSADEMEAVGQALKKLAAAPLAAGISEVRFKGKTCLCALVLGTRLFVAYTIRNQYIAPEGIGLRAAFALPE